MGFREVGINRHIQPGRSAFDPAQHQMLHRIKANCAAFESTLYPGFNIRDLEDLQQSQNLNELTFDVVARTQVVLVIGCSTSDLDT